MQEFVSIRSRGQTIVLVALVAVALIAFIALAVDGGNVYSVRREAQSAADGAAIAGTWVMVEYDGSSPGADILHEVNQYAQQNGVPDTNGKPEDMINDNVLAFYVYFDGSCVPLVGGPEGCWELHGGPNQIPNGARGVQVRTHISSTTFFARAIGIRTVEARARATARFERDGGLLPIAVNEYWLGSEGKCPYDSCGDEPVPYSFVRDPAQEPPFELVSSDPEVWKKNSCPDPYNLGVCQGPYEGQGSNFGLAFAILGADAKPNYNAVNPRSGVDLDIRYNALADGGTWHELLLGGTWQHNIKPPSQGDAKAAALAVILAGGYEKQPLPRAAIEPPPVFIGEYAYCWGTPNADNCFNYPEMDRSEPYDGLMFLNGASCKDLAKGMFNNGQYVQGRYAPGERIVIMVYNSFAAPGWGQGGKKEDVAVLVGYFGAIIVGYGNNMTGNCDCSPGEENWKCFHDNCLVGQENSVYALASSKGALTLDPEHLMEEFLPKKITLIKGMMDQ